MHSSQINSKTLNSEKKNPHTSEKQNCMAAIFYIYFKYFIDKSIGLDNRLCLYKSSPNNKMEQLEHNLHKT